MNENCPKHLRNVWLTACSALVLAAGCGGEEKTPDGAPRIDSAVASQLAERSDQIAVLIDANRICEAARAADELKTQVETEVASGRVPAALADELSSNAETLVNEVNCDAAPPEPPPESDEDDEGEGKGKGKGKKKGDGDD